MTVSPDTFEPSTDRYDPRKAATLFALLWPDPIIRKACAAQLAESICLAHQQASASWEVTLFRDYIRLNVGQVEALKLTAYEITFLFRAPLEELPGTGIEIRIDTPYVFPSVPVPSGVCYVPPEEMPLLPAAVREAHNAFIHEATARKKVSPFRKSFSPGIVDYLEYILGRRLPRPSYFTDASDQLLTRESLGIDLEPESYASPVPDFDTLAVASEGGQKLMTHLVRERSRAIVLTKRQQVLTATGQLACEACGFNFKAFYGTLGEGFCEVHHRVPLSEGGVATETRLEDLAILCSNCHRMIHRVVPFLTVEELKTRIDKGA